MSTNDTQKHRQKSPSSSEELQIYASSGKLENTGWSAIYLEIQSFVGSHCTELLCFPWKTNAEHQLFINKGMVEK